MKLSILGSTGSIGTQALEVVRDLKGIFDIDVIAVSGNSNIDLLESQIREFNPKYAAVSDEQAAKRLEIAVADTGCKVLSGRDGLCYIAAQTDADMVLSSIVGFAGLVPTMNAIAAGKDIALANKETLVTAGSLFMDAIKKSGVRLLPVDSEHCAIFQSLKSGRHSEVRKILLTASGGPFFGKERKELKNVRKEQALKHPNWSMGAKITIDSATLMNKGLEVLEAHWLFNVDIDNIKVVVQRESIIHSMVEFNDKSVIAQMSVPSMKHPIQYAFTYPNRLSSPDKEVDFAKLAKLTFAEPDEKTFRCLALAKTAGREGGIMPTVMNAANEAAVSRFLNDEIGFLDIADIVERAMSDFDNIKNPSLDDIIAADAEVRQRLGKS
ncbi:MAG: 1-deoxy-D-xylulose-5-phosphate reductoisomerase [Clostridia bacterium]|jgi:1-deoxy-D-xylulose-5-phosphate reductoisomerase|nr:1-deoxy-D-xylulose-5-phosphate reductoisomerase [Clostridia bacterium]